MGRGTTAKGEATKRRILDAAADLFHARGINATSMGEVLRAANAGKGQFYQHFKSRAELIQQVLKRHRAVIEQEFRPADIRSWADLRRFMDGHIQAQARFRFQRGCPLGTAAYALQAHQSEPRRLLHEAFSAVRRSVAGFLEQEQHAHRLASRADPKKLADFVVACLQGGLLLALLEADGCPGQAAVDEAFAHLESFRWEGDAASD